MKVSEFRSLIREEVKNVIKENRFPGRRKNLVKESYLKDINLYLDEFDNLDTESFKRLDSLFQMADSYMEANEKLYDAATNITHPDSFNDLPGMIMYYTDLAKLMKSKSPKLAKWATEILSILKTVRSN